MASITGTVYSAPLANVDVSTPTSINVQDHGITAEGADTTAGTGTAQDTAFAALVATATLDEPLNLFFPPGRYLFNAAWPTIDPELVNISGAGAFHTVIDFTTLTSGPAVLVRKSSSSNHQHVVFQDLKFLGPTASNTTVDCLSLGSAATYANQCVFERIHIDDFRNQVLLNDNVFCTEFVNCTLREAHGTAYKATGSPANSGEGLRWIGGTMFQAHVDCIDLESGAELDVIGASFDYAEHMATVGTGSRLNFTNCHFETGNGWTGTEMITLVKTSGFNSHLSVKQSTFLPNYTSASNYRTFIRITGATGSNNDNSVVTLDGLEIFADSDQAGVNALVIDDSTASTASSSTTESHIIVRGVSYRDAGGTTGSYYPFYIQDRADRKHLIMPGIDYGNLIYDNPHRASAWTFPTIHVLESIPHKIAVDTCTIASGDLYVVRLPITAGNGWVATATSLMLAISTVGATLSAQEMGLYDLGAETASPTTLTRIYRNTSMTYTANGNTIHSSTPGALQVSYPRRQYFGAVLVVGTTGPTVYGLKAVAASPLLDPASSHFTLEVGKLTGQTGLPGSITVSNLAKSEFVPWMAIKPTAY